MTPPPSAPLDETTTLPPYLRDCPTELDDLPLQVQLLTGEVAELRLAFQRLSRMLGQMAIAVEPARVLGQMAALIEKVPSDG